MSFTLQAREARANRGLPVSHTFHSTWATALVSSCPDALHSILSDAQFNWIFQAYVLIDVGGRIPAHASSQKSAEIYNKVRLTAKCEK